MKAVLQTKSTRMAGIGTTCNCFDLKRDAYYKFQKRQKKREAVASKVV